MFLIELRLFKAPKYDFRRKDNQLAQAAEMVTG